MLLSWRTTTFKLLSKEKFSTELKMMIYSSCRHLFWHVLKSWVDFIEHINIQHRKSRRKAALCRTSATLLQRLCILLLLLLLFHLTLLLSREYYTFIREKIPFLLSRKGFQMNRAFSQGIITTKRNCTPATPPVAKTETAAATTKRQE